MKKSLYPIPDPIQVNPMGVLIWSFIFALAFFVIGIMTVHYPKMVI